MKKKKRFSRLHFFLVVVCPVGGVGLASCDVFLAGGACDVLWLMELDLISLKGGAVSCSLCGSSMCLGSPSGPGSVRHIYFHSCFKVALPAYLHCRQPPTVPGIIAMLLFPCPTLHC